VLPVLLPDAIMVLVSGSWTGSRSGVSGFRSAIALHAVGQGFESLVAHLYFSSSGL
jgi:hypothetical protein